MYNISRYKILNDINAELKSAFNKAKSLVERLDGIQYQDNKIGGDFDCRECKKHVSQEDSYDTAIELNILMVGVGCMSAHDTFEDNELKFCSVECIQDYVSRRVIELADDARQADNDRIRLTKEAHERGEYWVY